MILVDTSVLSQVFRRAARDAPPSATVARFRSLVETGLPLAIPGVVFQEILSGVPDPRQFERLRGALSGFPLILAGEGDHLEAAHLVNRLRREGFAASSFDALIAAMAISRNAVLFTLDRDFESFARFAALRLLDERREA